jgi:hypothetical protein
VIAIRQAVRQMARDLGLELSRQVKIATAISTIARALIAANWSTTMQMRIDDHAPRPRLEIACSLAVEQTPEDLAHLEQVLQFGAARTLVDEASLALDGHGALLCLRIWLSR